MAMSSSRCTTKKNLFVGTISLLLVLLGSIFFAPVHPSFSDNFFAASKNATDPTWLLLTNSAVDLIQRRQIIRATWQKTYADPRFTMRFVLGQPDDIWMPVIQHENDTYNDIIIMPRFYDTYWDANHNKPIQFLRYVAEGNLGGQAWKFISKVDDDSFINLHGLYQDFVAPRLDIGEDKLVAIGRNLSKNGWRYPGGQFYTLSWRLVQVLAECWTANPIFDEDEDALIGRVLGECGEIYDEFVVLDNRLAFDYDPNVGDPDAWSHKVFPGSLNPHRLKDAKTFLSVAAMFDNDGVRNI